LQLPRAWLKIFADTLTPRMNFPLKLFLTTLPATSSAADVAGLSEAELLARYPALAIAAGILFLLGLICDAYLLIRLTRANHAMTAGKSTLFKVESKPWGLPELGVATIIVLVVLATGSGTLLALSQRLHWDETDETSLLLAGQMFMYVAILTGFVCYCHRRNLGVAQNLGLRLSSSLGAILLGMIFYLAILPPLAIVFAVSTKLCQMVGIEPTPQPIADFFVSSDSLLARSLLVGFAVVVAPVAEEVFFRGFAYPAFKQRWGMGWALAVVSIIFALIHQHVPSIGPLFALAVGLALAYEWTGSLLAPITMHALFNLTNVAMLMYVRAHS
jgi:membrane protease YdiL (CAAX protease family)